MVIISRIMMFIRSYYFYYMVIILPISIHSSIVHDEEHIYQTLSRKLVTDNISYFIISFMFLIILLEWI